MTLNKEIWLPYLHFTLQTIAMYYPLNPNKVTKRKYYDFIQNLPLFFPEYPFGNNFIDLLNKYPVSPYLESKLSFKKWIHFVFNHINKDMNKEEKSFDEWMNEYYENYKPKEIKELKLLKKKKKYIIFGVIFLLLSLTIYLYNKKY